MTRRDAHEDLEARLAVLAEAEADLRERERLAIQDDPTPEGLMAFAAEHDKLSDDRDALADAYDGRARGRDLHALGRDVGGSDRDRSARSRADDLDEGALDRFAAGEDRDRAAGDRSDSFDDRGRSAQARRSAADDRGRAAADRQKARAQAAESSHEITGLQEALQTRLQIGQAQGVLMVRHGLDADEAFALLVRLSQSRNIKLREVAAKLVTEAAANTQASSGDPATR